MPSNLTPARATVRPLRPLHSLLLALGSVLCFHVSFLGSPEFLPAGFLLFGYLAALGTLHRQTTARRAFWWGSAVGLGIFVPQTAFLGSVFSVPVGGFNLPLLALVLWLLVSLWHGVFLLLWRSVEHQLGSAWAWVLAPVFWMGLEYFRSEVWWLRFSWLAVGGAFEGPAGWWRLFGVYGMGGIAWTVLASLALARRLEAKWRWTGRMGIGLTMAALVASGMPRRSTANSGRTVSVAGVQKEFPTGDEVLQALNRVVTAHPAAELLLLSEYTFDSPPPSAVRDWCREQGKWLVVGGKEPADDAALPGSANRVLAPGSDGTSAFRNTAFVVSPTGDVDFTQAKVQPIQFFADGLPARSQSLWRSPWGPLGIAICYDASYRQVLDELIRQGARGLLLPTMDVLEWGRHEHALNARQARLRVREYGVPGFRLASSGPSMLLDSAGRTVAAAPFGAPGEGAVLSGTMLLADAEGGLPLDASVAPICAGWTGGWALWGLVQTVAHWWRRVGRRRHPVPGKMKIICG